MSRDSRRLAAVVITAAILAGALWLSRSGNQRAAAPSAETPEACVERMFSAAERGDTAAYLDCFTGAERERLARELAGQTPQAFGQSLQQAIQDLKGRAIFAASGNVTSPAEARLTVERVYLNRTERQIYRLQRDGDRWRIADVQAAQPYQPANAYGTPVYEAAPNRPDKSEQPTSP